ncbi:MAG: MotA/TolQ/ExbB proton channel family protein [Longimicrobiales bacterium]
MGVQLYALLLQIPGLDAPDLTWREQIARNWIDTGWMRWPLLVCAIIGLGVSVVKFYSLGSKATKTKKVLKTVDELLAQRRVNEAMELTRASDTPAGRILYAGLERHTEGTERVSKAIENQGLIEMSKLERGLIVLATVINVAPLLGFLGTVFGMILAFQAIEAAGEVEATLVAGGIKVALLTTAFGLLIAIPVSVFHNYFISKIDTLVIDMEESAQKVVDTLHSIEVGRG